MRKTVLLLGVLMTAFVPSASSQAQPKEEPEAGTGSATESLLSAAIEEYQQLNGHFPTSLALLSQTGLNPELLASLSSGYHYTLELLPPGAVTAADYVVQGTPAAPGQTGREECTINHERIMRCGPTSGADHSTSVMWARIAARAASTIANLALVSSPAVTPDQIRNNLALASTVTTVFQQLDTNNNGQVSITDVLQSGVPNAPDLNNAYGAFLAGISQDLALGVGNEHVSSLPGVRIFQLSSPRLCDGSQWSPCTIFPEPPQ